MPLFTEVRLREREDELALDGVLLQPEEEVGDRTTPQHGSLVGTAFNGLASGGDSEGDGHMGAVPGHVLLAQRLHVLLAGVAVVLDEDPGGLEEE